MSSAISAAIRARSSRDSPASWRELLGDLGLDPLADGAAVLDVEETRAELADEREVDPVLQLRERIGRAAVAVPVRCQDRRADRRVRDALVELHRQLAFRSSSRRRPLSLATATGIAGTARVALGESRVRPGRLRLRLGDDDRLPVRERTRDRAVAADEHVRRAAEQLLDVEQRDADARVGTVEHERDRPRVVAHLLERLEADLRVLERERVEHPDDEQVRRRVDRRDHLGRERRRGVDEHEVVPRAEDLEHLPQERRRDRRRLIRAKRREQRPRAGGMVGEEALDLVAVERSARGGQVVDRLRRLEPERQPDVAELEVEVDEHRRAALERQRDRKVGRRHRLAGAALRPEHGDHLALGRGRHRAAAPRQRLLEREAELARRLRQRDEVVRAGLERPLEEAVRRAVVENDDRPVGPLRVRRRDHLERLVVRLRAADDDEIGAVLELAAGAAGVGERHRAKRRADRQRLPDRVEAEVALERRVDVKAAGVHGRPPDRLQDLHRRNAEQHGLDRDDPGLDRLRAGARPQRQPELAVVGGEGELRRLDVVDREADVRRCPIPAPARRRRPRARRPGSAAASAAPGRR